MRKSKSTKFVPQQGEKVKIRLDYKTTVVAKIKAFAKWKRLYPEAEIISQ